MSPDLVTKRALVIDDDAAGSEMSGQERVVSPHSKGGTPLNQKWEGVPAEFRSSITFPDWPLPTDLRRWERDRLEVRRTLLTLMGDLPARPARADAVQLPAAPEGARRGGVGQREDPELVAATRVGSTSVVRFSFDEEVNAAAFVTGGPVGRARALDATGKFTVRSF